MASQEASVQGVELHEGLQVLPAQVESYARTINSLVLILEKKIADFPFHSIPGMHTGEGLSVGV